MSYFTSPSPKTKNTLTPMKTLQFLRKPLLAALLLSPLLLNAQPVVLATTKSGDTTYTINSTGALQSNLATIEILLVTERSDGKANTSIATIRTGKSKTVKQIMAQLAEAFNRSGPNSPPETPLTVIGHLDHGGELRVMSDTAGGVRFDYFSTSAPITQIRFNPEQTDTLRKMFASYL